MNRMTAVPTAACAVLAAGAALASSHSDSPKTKQDPQTNLTDVYAFVGRKYDDPGTTMLNVVVNVRPFSEPGDGPTFDRFADDALYSIHIAKPASGSTVIRYDFRFSGVDDNVKNEDTIISYGVGDAVGAITTVGGPEQNFVQKYRVTRSGHGPDGVLGSGLLVAPPNAGNRVTPAYNDADGRAVSGATSFAELDTYTQQTIYDLPSGEVVFAGPRDDSFFADVPGIFDLLNPRILETDGNGVNGFKGFNVLTFAIQIPIEHLPSFDYESVFFGEQQGVGVYASVSRPEVRRIRADGTLESSGGWVQVNRQGNPLFAEVLVALEEKDKFNFRSPKQDKALRKYARNPELATLINFVFGTSFVETNREDLVNIFIPDVLRVNTTTGPVRLDGEPGFSRLGFIGGDMTAGISSGWPNGRRLGDDVIDIALTAIASGPSYQSITLLGDNVNANDVLYHQVFPYAATPNSSTNNSKDSVTAPSPASASPSGDLNGDGAVNDGDLLILINNWRESHP